MDIVEDCVNQVQVLAKEHDLTISIMKEPDLPEIYLNVDSISRALMNIVSNAIKYSPDGKRIKIRAERSRDGEFAMSWADFKNKFKNLEYYAGYGTQEIAADLVVVGDNWWLEREEYDGSECWAYKKYPKITSGKSFDEIIGSWQKIADIMEEE